MAKEKLKRINSEIHIESAVDDLTVKNVETYLDGIDLVVDGTDNFETRFLLNDAHINRKFIHMDLVDMEFYRINVEKSNQCPVCHQGVYEYLQGDKLSTAISVCGRDMVQITPKEKCRVSLEELRNRLKTVGKVSFAGYLLKFVKDDYELIIFPDGRTFVKGTTDTVLARNLYSKSIGY